MSIKRKRQGGGWLLATLGVIAAAIGVRAANEAGWIDAVFNQDRPTFQTVSTGASVQVSTQANNSDPNNPSGTNQAETNQSGSDQTDQSQSFTAPSDQSGDSAAASPDSYTNDSTDRYRGGRRARW